MHTHTCQHGDPRYYVAFICLCERIQHSTRLKALLWHTLVAVHLAQEGCDIIDIDVISLMDLYLCISTYAALSFLFPLFAICCSSPLFCPVPFSICGSLISSCHSSIKGVREVCHLTFLPTAPFIFIRQRKEQRLTVGFRHVLFHHSALLYHSSAMAFAISILTEMLSGYRNSWSPDWDLYDLGPLIYRFARVLQ